MFYTIEVDAVLLVVAIIVIVRIAYKMGNDFLSVQQSERQKMIDLAYVNLSEKEVAANAELNRVERELHRIEELNITRVDRYKQIMDTAANEIKQSYPWMSGQVADAMKMYDMEVAYSLMCKPRPALKAADEIKQIAKEKRAIQKKNRMLEYQLAYYEKLFPWLEEFKAVPPKDGWAYVNDSTFEERSEYETLKNWLSPEEYQKLPTAEKYQKALDRYKSRKKNDWEAGIEYERYIGYLAEQTGAKVCYAGAREGLEDMGRDLLVDRGDKVFVIQCKRWAKSKKIHEKNIFQLFGTTTLLRVENPKKQYVGVFVTSTALSDVAKKCAEALEIEVIENCALEDYPMIKCHASQNQKIYHLPMDQQYDRVQIGGKDGSMFAWTVKEAEENGFRRAYRWNPHKGQ